MTILDAMQTVLRSGCGVSFEEAVRSERYAELESQFKSLSKRFPARTHRGIALRAGHLQMGRLLNTTNERQTIKLARSAQSEFGHGQAMTPLIQLVGEYLVRAATECLPDDVVALAKEWHEADVDHQIEIARTLFFRFNSEGQRHDEEFHLDTVTQNISKRITTNAHDPKKILPKQFGMWDTKTCIANCQGKTQMITAFGRLAGTDVLAVSPLTTAHEVLEGWRSVVADRIREDLAQRKIEFPEPVFMDSLKAYEIDKVFSDFDMHFHVGAALKLRDGRWVLIDSHAMSWGVFTPDWRLDKIVSLLDKYGVVLPGIHLLSHSYEARDEHFRTITAKVDDLLSHSRKLEQLMASVKSVPDLLDVFATSGEALYLANATGGESQQVSDTPGGEISRFVATKMIVGESVAETVRFIAQSKTDPHTLIRKKIGSILTFYHSLAMECVKNQLTDAGKLIHPECEFALAEYNIAISAINSIIPEVTIESQRFFLDYTFNQMSLFNSLGEFRPKSWRDNDPKIAIAAAQALEVMPFVHPLAQRALRSIC